MQSARRSGVPALLSLSAALLASVAALAFPAAGAAWSGARAAGPQNNHRHPLPDLAVKGFEFESTDNDDRIPHVVIDSANLGSFALHFDVENDGRHFAHPSNVRVTMNGQRLDVFRTPRLAPRAHHTYRHTFNPIAFAKPGLYQIRVCSDFGDSVNEAKEGNNCGHAITARVVAKRWNVEIFSRHETPFGGDLDTVVDPDAMNFQFDGLAYESYSGKLGFIWTARGAVSETFVGDFGGCGATGNGSASHSPWSIGQPKGWFFVSADLDKYGALVEDTSASYPVAVQCPMQPVYYVPYTITRLQTYNSGGSFLRAMSPEAKSLSGSFSVPQGSANFSWYFLANVH